MALNLLSSYGSDDDSDCEHEPSTSTATLPKELTNQNGSFTSDGNGSDTSSSSDEGAPESTKNDKEPTVEEPPKKKLLPSVADVFNTQIKVGVLVNKYEREALDREAILSHHVPITDAKMHKPVCKLFRKGLCRRGKNCRYEHPEEQPNTTPNCGVAAQSAPVYKGQEMKARPPKSRF